MKRIAFLGCENSHADAFIKFIQANPEDFSDIEIVGVYSDDLEKAQKLNEKYGVPVMADYADAVGKLDGVVITARRGDNHYKYAKPYIESGIPMFIDKPITFSEEEAVEFMQVLKAKSIRISGGSSLKQDAYVKQLKKEAEEEDGGKTLGGYVRAPYSRENDYGNFYFYAPHLVEIVCEVFGRYPLSVTARENGEQIHVLFHYEDYDCVGLYCNKNYVYYASRMAEKTVHSAEIPSTSDWFCEEFKEFYALLGGGEQPSTYEDFIAPVFVMNAILRSMESGKEEAVNRFTV
jgi:predicted dehydrogenase